MPGEGPLCRKVPYGWLDNIEGGPCTERRPSAPEGSLFHED